MEKSFEPVKSCPNIENVDEEITVKPGEGPSEKGMMIVCPHVFQCADCLVLED